MINWKVPAGFFIVWLVFTICANIIEMSDPVSANDATIFGMLFLHQAPTTSDVGFLQNLQNLPVVAGDWLEALWNAIWFDYNWMKVDFLGKLLRYVCFGLSFGLFVSFIMYLFVRK